MNEKQKRDFENRTYVQSIIRYFNENKDPLRVVSLPKYLGAKYAPTTYGLSIIPMVGGLYFLGLYGGDVSNSVGDGAEYFVFDLYDDTVELVSSTVDWSRSKL